MLVLRPTFTIALPGGRELTLGHRTLVMAIVNVTPDSFADGGERFDPDTAIADALRMVGEGADILDIGGESTRPGAPPLDEAEELRRVLPVLEGLRGRVDVPVSIDTYKSTVASAALGLGASIVNDISAFANDPALAGVVAKTGAAAVLMHNRGRSKNIYEFAQYTDVIADIRRDLAARVAVAERAGVRRAQLILDPGFGFAKRAEHSMEALARLAELHDLNLPILSGPSRKSFLKLALGDVPASQRVWGTAAAVTASIMAGAHIVRVHDVAAMTQVAKVADSIRAADRPKHA
jgi:dihydropteroate synthase